LKSQLKKVKKLTNCLYKFEMNYKLIGIIKDKYGVPGVLVTNYLLVHPYKLYQNKISKTKFHNFNTPLYLEYKFHRGEKILLRDFEIWDSGSPNAHCIVCSPHFRSVLEKLNLPPHRFYNAEIDVLGKPENYFVLHFIFEYLDVMNFYQSRFAQAELMKTEPIEKLFAKGEIENKDQYNALNTKLIDMDKWIYPRRIVFPTSHQFDVFALGGSIVLSENAKNEIEKAGITGVAMPSLNENEHWKGVEIEFANLPHRKPQAFEYQTKEVSVLMVEEPKVEYQPNTNRTIL